MRIWHHAVPQHASLSRSEHWHGLGIPPVCDSRKAQDTSKRKERKSLHHRGPSSAGKLANPRPNDVKGTSISP